MKKTHYIYSIILLVFLASAHPVSAVLMQGDKYNLRTEPFNTFTKERIFIQNSQNQEIQHQDTQVSQQNPLQPQEASTNQSTTSFTITPNAIDFGTLTAGEPIQRTAKIAIKSSDGFTLQIAEDSLLTSGNATIPNTTCDNGACSPGIASQWQSPLVYGFGYTCQSSIDCIGFSGADKFKPLPNLAENMSPQSIIKNQESNQVKAELTFKVNIPPTSAGKKYKNNIILYSLPNY